MINNKTSNQLILFGNMKLLNFGRVSMNLPKLVETLAMSKLGGNKNMTFGKCNYLIMFDVLRVRFIEN